MDYAIPSWPGPARAGWQGVRDVGWRVCGSYYNEYANRYDECLAWPVSVRHALLALLSEGPKYGLRLQQEFEERTGEVWPLNVGQVYITLQRLERDGLVESGGERGAGPQKRFVITPAGGAELDGWLRTPSGDVPPPRDELVIKVLISLRVPGADVHDIVQVHRRHMIELMQRYWHLKAEAGEDDIGLALIADAELFRLDGIVRWLDAADARLKLHPAPDPASRPAAAGVPAPPVQRPGAGVRR
jgi:DNA-binding PadR family transcriptional regulator